MIRRLCPAKDAMQPSQEDRPVKTPPTARIAPAIILLAMIGLNSAASASAIATLYNTTDLGAGYQLQTDSSGYTSAVTGADGSVYAFGKSPVTSINLRTDFYIHDAYQLLTMQNGSHQTGYIYDFPSGTGISWILHPSFENIFNGWQTSVGQSPVLDINSNGQVVGTSLNLVVGSTGPPVYAAFSDVNGQSHGFAAQTVDNLNNYIIPIPGVNLTSAVKIDDLGRIIAVGSNGDNYLLTPVALGPPSPTPEPTTLAVLAVASAGFAIRRRFLHR